MARAPLCDRPTSDGSRAPAIGGHSLMKAWTPEGITPEKSRGDAQAGRLNRQLSSRGTVEPNVIGPVDPRAFQSDFFGRTWENSSDAICLCDGSALPREPLRHA